MGCDLRLKPEQCNRELCRPFKAHSKFMRFCCHDHLVKSQVKSDTDSKKPPKGREAMDTKQLVHLFHILLRGEVWPAVLMLLQLFCGDRADACRRARASWLCDFAPEAPGAPKINIPKTNGKTVAREVPVPMKFAMLVHKWMWVDPLKNTAGKQWPSHAHGVKSGGRAPTEPPWPSHAHGVKSGGRAPTETPCDWFLFPGRGPRCAVEGEQPQPVTERAYFKALQNAVEKIADERAAARAKGEDHVFENFDLSRLGTHSMKKSFVTIMKEERISTSLVSALTGTTAFTLESIYDIATAKRQRLAVQQTLGSVLEDVAHQTHQGQEEACNRWRFCPHCGEKLPENGRARFCHQCGQELLSHLSASRSA